MRTLVGLEALAFGLWLAAFVGGWIAIEEPIDAPNPVRHRWHERVGWAAVIGVGSAHAVAMAAIVRRSPSDDLRRALERSAPLAVGGAALALATAALGLAASAWGWSSLWHLFVGTAALTFQVGSVPAVLLVARAARPAARLGP